MKNIVILFILMLFVSSCKQSTSSDYSINYQDNYNAKKEHPGKKLLETNCYTCHGLKGDHDSRIAPPMFAIKMHYISDGITKEEFIEDIQTWVERPSEDISKMPGAVRRFGVMPYSSFDKEDVKQIADYLYDNEIGQPSGCEDEPNNKGKRKRKGKM